MTLEDDGIIRKKIDVEIELSPDECALGILRLDGIGLAKFFNKIAVHAKREHICGLCFHLQDLLDEGKLNSEGRRMMRMIGEYAE